MTHILNIITGFIFGFLFLLCSYFTFKAKDCEEIEDEYNYSVKADLCLACILIIFVVRLIIMYLYK